jgi:uncharacterized protein
MTVYREDNRMKLAFHIMAKPIGPICNLSCEYCFYLEKEAMFPRGEDYRMSDDVLEAYIKQVTEAHADIPELLFSWQGGEPTLMGIDFFKKAIELERNYAAGKPFMNTLQTNGTLLDDEWCRFLAKNKFLVGLSLDGPRELHDQHRKTRGGEPTFDEVMRGLELLKKHRVEFNILACVNRETAKQPLEVYQFFKDQGVEYIQFIPIVERMPEDRARELDLQLGVPAPIGEETGPVEVTPWTVEPEMYGDFLITVFDEWVRSDVGTIFIMNFDWALVSYVGAQTPPCFFAPTCGNAAIIEHNGDIYSCDHYVYPGYRLGNILTDDLAAMMDSEAQRSFSAQKEKLPRYCHDCPVLRACYGECPKHRFVESPDGEPGLNYLCAGYRKYFSHIAPYLKVITDLLTQGRPASEIMEKTIVIVPRKDDQRYR